MKVNKGPLPIRYSSRNLRYPFDSMEMGDWVQVADITSAERMQNAAHAYGKRMENGFRLSRRQIPNSEGYYLVRVK